MNDPRGWSTLLDGIRKLLLDVIGSPTDTGGSAAETVLGKQNEVLEAVSLLSGNTRKIPCIKWARDASLGKSVSVNSGETKTLEFTVTEDIFMSSFAISSSKYQRALEVETTIAGRTFADTLSNSTSSNMQRNYLITNKGVKNGTFEKDFVGLFIFLPKGSKLTFKGKNIGEEATTFGVTINAFAVEV